MTGGTGAALPSVGVVIPVRNGAHLVADTIESVLAQTYPGPVTVLLVDDASTDGTADLVRARWPEVRVMPIPASGLAVGRNRGAAALGTDWVAFLDGDDVWHPEHLALLLEYAAAHPDAHALSAGSIRFSTSPLADPRTADPLDIPGPPRAASVPPRVIPDPSTIRDLPVEPLADGAWLLRHEDFLHGNPITSANGLFRREHFWAAGGFPAALAAAEDYGFWLAVSLLGPVHCTPGATFFYRVAEASMSSRTNVGLSHIAAVLPHLLSVDLERRPEVVGPRLTGHELAGNVLWLASRSAIARGRPAEEAVVTGLTPLLVPRRRRRWRFRLSHLVARTRNRSGTPT
ncbi:glycosyltransferase [Nocardioides sp. YIM 152588]|uniref:glycosyltransferase family A protein n=1 Tax=Nocardioides sp. YIM 152588 TaxID=3158259 RepID=UPI0032E4CE37